MNCLLIFAIFTELTLRSKLFNNSDLSFGRNKCKVIARKSRKLADTTARSALRWVRDLGHELSAHWECFY